MTKTLHLCLAAAILLVSACGSSPDLSGATPLSVAPRLDPDYTGLVIPPNIAPMGFRVLEAQDDYVVHITSLGGDRLELDCPQGACRPPLDAWHQLLQQARGQDLTYDVYGRDADGGWVHYSAFTNHVAPEPIDGYIVFRQLAPNSQFTTIKGIFQRSLESFEREALVTLRGGTIECVNCHTFYQNNPDRFMFHVRRKHSGTVFVIDGKIRKVNTRQGPMFRPLAFASWHPDGEHVAATLNMYVGNSPSTVEGYQFQAFEKRGDLAVYNVVDNTISTTAAVFGDDYIETHPYCSPDGRYIYYARGRDQPLLAHQDLHRLKFDLARVPFDAETETWGTPETVVAYSEVGLSCAFPCPSPDGRILAHILSDYGTYPIYQKSSDVTLLNLETREWVRPETINSEFAESFPRWSSNSRWLSFVSNRRDGRSALPYFAYVDSGGQAHKAFVLPQRDPDHYDTFMDTYNVLEQVKSRVDVDTFELAQAILQPAEDADFPDPPATDARTSATRLYLEQVLQQQTELQQARLQQDAGGTP